MASKQQQAFKMCVHPCPRYLTGGDTHILCVACLGEEHAQSARETAGCEHCNVLPLRTLRSRLALFREDAQARVPQGFRVCRGTAKAAVLWFAKGSVSGGRDGHRIISAFTWHIQCLVSGLGSTRCVFFRPDRGTHTLQLSDSEELDVVSANARGTGLATSVSCLWGAGWGCDMSGWEIKYWFASREWGRSFKRQTWRTLLAHNLNAGDCRFFLISTPRCRDHGRNWFPIESIVHKQAC